jgi:hypothetical protein
MHRKLFLNPKYGKMGLLGYPFWFFFEWMAPLLEAFGYLLLVYLIAVGMINWPIFIFMLVFVYLFSVSFSFFKAIIFGKTLSIRTSK